jgi:hypothetical protein
MHKLSFIITSVISAALFVGGCSKSQIPPNANVQDLGIIRLKPQIPKQLPLSGDLSLYCAFGRPEQLPEKLETVMTLTNLPDGSLHLCVENIPTPRDYKRLCLKHAEFTFRSGAHCELKIGENAWLRFTPVLEEN